MAPRKPPFTQPFLTQSQHMANGVEGQIGAGIYNYNYASFGIPVNANSYRPTSAGVYCNFANSLNASNQSYNYSSSNSPLYTYQQQVTLPRQQADYSQLPIYGQQVNYGQNYASGTHQTNYPQQGNSGTAQVTYPSMDYSQWGNSQYGTQQYYGSAQQHQYQPTPPQIRNPFAPPPPARSQYTGQNAQHDPEYEAQVAQWQSAYAPADPYERGKKGGKTDKGENPNMTNLGTRQGPIQGAENSDANAKGATGEKKKTVVRKGGGETWEDDTLLEWDPTQFRIMVGNLAGEVTDDSLLKAFAAYGPSKARVVRDKRTTKSKGFGFVAFTDGENGFKAAREMAGKYIGSHPIVIQRSKTNIKPVVKNDKHKGKNKNKDKEQKQNDPLHAHTGAHIEKKPVKNPAGYKILG